MYSVPRLSFAHGGSPGSGIVSYYRDKLEKCLLRGLEERGGKTGTPAWEGLSWSGGLGSRRQTSGQIEAPRSSTVRWPCLPALPSRAAMEWGTRGARQEASQGWRPRGTRGSPDGAVLRAWRSRRWPGRHHPGSGELCSLLRTAWRGTSLPCTSTAVYQHSGKGNASGPVLETCMFLTCGSC